MSMITLIVVNNRIIKLPKTETTLDNLYMDTLLQLNHLLNLFIFVAQVSGPAFAHSTNHGGPIPPLLALVLIKAKAKLCMD